MIRVIAKGKNEGEDEAKKTGQIAFLTAEIKNNSFILASQKCRAVVYSMRFCKENSREPSAVLTCDKMCAI